MATRGNRLGELRGGYVLAACAACAPAPVAAVAVARTEVVPAVKAPTIARTAIHSGSVVAVALADRGDAALTADDQGGMRLWPALDGTREPVIVPARNAPKQLVIEHAGSGFVGAVLDDAGGVEVMSFDATGVLLARTQLDNDPPVQQIAGFGDGVLVVRADQVLVLVGADGRARSQLVPPERTQIARVATRRGGAIALLAGRRRDRSDLLRRLTLVDGKLAWGQEIELPVAIDTRTLALSPDQFRIAAVEAMNHTSLVLDLHGTPTALNYDLKASAADAALSLGFLDDNHAIMADDSTRYWWMPHGPFERAIAGALHVSERAVPVAFGDGVAIAAEQAGLEVVGVLQTRHLGYQEIPWDVQGLDRGGPHTWITIATSRDRADAAVDDALHVHEVEPKAFSGDLQRDEVFLDAANRAVLVVLTQRLASHPDANYQLLIIDDEKRQQHAIAHFDGRPLDPTYEPTTRTLGFRVGTKVYRYRFDPVKGWSATTLPALDLVREMQVQITDPAAASGAIAIASDDQMIVTFLDELHEERHTHSGNVIGMDRSGATYTIDPGGTLLRVYRRGEPMELRLPFAIAHAKTPAEAGVDLAVSPDLQRFAVLGASELVAFDAKGRVLWQRTIPRPEGARWSADSKSLLVMTANGLLSLGASSGATVARACAWQFGLSETPLPTTTLTAPNVCEDAR